MATTTFTSRIRRVAAKRRLTVSSVAHVPTGYARSLRPRAARFSPAADAASSGGDC